MAIWLVAALGGAAGTAARYWTMRAASLWLGTAFPWGTLAVNFFGSLAIGGVVTLLTVLVPDRGPIRSLLSAGLVTGFLGGYTTFSAFSLDLVHLIEQNAWGAALLYGAGSVALGGVGVLLGRMAVCMAVGA